MHNSLLNSIATDIVMDKVIEDKVKEVTKEQQQKKEEKELAEQAFPDLDEMDSEEERIMQKELEKRKEKADEFLDLEEKKVFKKYGDYRDIVETEFLDTLLKHTQVVCHFYHNEFERCKIIDKHLKLIAQEHTETLFVRINAEKTPFFTAKLNIRVYKISYNRYYLLLSCPRMVRSLIGLLGLKIWEELMTLKLLILLRDWLGLR
jgi:hypothetical protein